MRQLAVGTALIFASLVGGVVAAGAAYADGPTTDDWNVRRTYVGYAGCAVGVGYDSVTDSYCVEL
jgi:hypothetical protein